MEFIDGIVVYNIDPQCKGRVKIYVYGIYPIQYKDQHKFLPWAQPAMSIFGGNWINERTQSAQLNCQTGVCAVPHAGIGNTDGAQVFLFFQAGDINKPIYFAAAQSGRGWFSQHPNQFVVQTDNVRVRIDQQSTDFDYKEFGTAKNKTTCYFSTYNSKCHSKYQDRKRYKALTDIQLYAKDDIAINLVINGNVNLKINGDKYQEINGDIYYTHIGNKYIRHQGNTYLQDVGKRNLVYTGTLYNEINGNIQELYRGDYTFSQTGMYYTITINALVQKNIYGQTISKYTGNVTQTYSFSLTKTINNSLIINSNTYQFNNVEGLSLQSISVGDTIFSNNVKIKNAATGMITFATAGVVADGIVIGIS